MIERSNTPIVKAEKTRIYLSGPKDLNQVKSQVLFKILVGGFLAGYGVENKIPVDLTAIPGEPFDNNYKEFSKFSNEEILRQTFLKDFNDFVIQQKCKTESAIKPYIRKKLEELLGDSSLPLCENNGKDENQNSNREEKFRSNLSPGVILNLKLIKEKLEIDRTGIVSMVKKVLKEKNIKNIDAFTFLYS